MIDTGGDDGILNIGNPTLDSIPALDVNSTLTADEADTVTAAGVEVAANRGQTQAAVEFGFDPVANFNGGGGTETAFSPSVLIDTQSTNAGLADPADSALVDYSVAIGTGAQGFGGAAGLRPNTRYYYWLDETPGEDSDATLLDTADNSGDGTAPTWTCTLNADLPDPETMAGVVNPTQPPPSPVPSGYYTVGQSTDGSCIYAFGAPTSSAMGTFTTPGWGKVVVGAVSYSGHQATVSVTNRGRFAAAGKLELMAGGTTIGSASFSLPGRGTRQLGVALRSHRQAAAAGSLKVRLRLVMSTGQLVTGRRSSTI